jgi:hypothetical protein
VQPLTPEPRAKGPSLFVASAVRADGAPILQRTDRGALRDLRVEG